MSIKRILAAAAASVVAVSAMAVVASAAITNPNDGTKYVYDAAADLGDKVGDCYGVTVSITPAAADLPDGIGGGICANNDPFTWTEFGNDGAGKAITTDGKTITLKGDSALFQSDAPQIIIEGWWGSDFTVDGIVYLDKDGNDLKNAAPAESKPEESKPEESKTEDSKTESKPNVDTGVEGVAAVVGVAAVAAGALVVAKKRK